jgi:S1-C subfamily serine protease
VRAVAAVAALAVALGAGACGRDGDEPSGDATRTVETRTRVEVLRNVDGAGRARFDPEAIYRQESPGVVTVISEGVSGGSAQPGGLGSGFVVSGEGEIVTNAHVVTSGTGASIREVDEVFVRFKDRNQVPARIVGFDPFADVALLRVDPAGLTLRPLPLGSTQDLVVGSPVAAIGSPFGEEQSLSIGVISATDRSIESLTGFATTGAIQTDAAINQGNSGGPLLDAAGRVLGINSQIRTNTGEGSGVGFAVPVDVVRRSVDQLRRTGEARYAYLGVATVAVYPQLAEEFDLPARAGAWIQEVTRDGPGDDAGLRAGDGGERRFHGRAYVPGGDVVTAVEGTPIRAEADLAKALQRFAPGATVTLDVAREDGRRRVRVELGERPLDAPR